MKLGSVKGRKGYITENLLCRFVIAFYTLFDKRASLNDSVMRNSE